MGATEAPPMQGLGWVSGSPSNAISSHMRAGGKGKISQTSSLFIYNFVILLTVEFCLNFAF